MPKPSNHTQPIDNCLTLNLSKFKKWGYLKDNVNITNGSLKWGNTASIGFKLKSIDDNTKEITLIYKHGNEPINYTIKIVSIPTNLGNGKRWYFICPHTGGRCLKLISPSRQKYFLHRTAFNLMYQNQKYSKLERLRSVAYYGSYEKYKALGKKLFSKHGRTLYKGNPSSNF